MLPRRCIVQGCAEWCDPGSSRCAAHVDPNVHFNPRPDVYDSDWRRLSARFRQQHRWCEYPGCAMPSEEADHIVPVRIDPSRRLDPTNLRALCRSHHRLITGQTRYARGAHLTS